MSEEELKEREVETPGENGDGAAVPSEGEPPETEIRDTDIVFDCPHCGHNLAIDYRGAGLQINCVNCGESVLVPIPDGMKIDDLDIEPGEILKQLFATRRHLQKAEQRIEELERLENNIAKAGAMTAMLESMEGDLNADMADEAAFEGEEEGGEDGASGK